MEAYEIEVALKEINKMKGALLKEDKKKEIQQLDQKKIELQSKFVN